MTNRRRRRGNALIEFTLVGVPVIFLLISTFEMARGMWIYHTLVNAVKQGARYASVHGQLCATSPNTCTIKIADVAGQIQNAGVGLTPAQLSLTLSTQGGGTVVCTLDNCLTNTTAPYPDPAGNGVGNTIEIDALYPFSSMICMFWPAGGSTLPLGTINLPASARERIRF